MRLFLDICFFILLIAAVSGLAAIILTKIICRLYDLKHKKNPPSTWKH